MCGIAGFVQRAAVSSTDVIHEQLKLLDHRGPDSTGFFSGRRAVIGQTRLAVIDLFTGDPPIQNEDLSVGVALNGEVYNYPALQARLRAEGHRLRTGCDTEVIAHLAENLKPTELARSLDGMFAFAVWDENRERLVLGRDRVGKKPLYYWRSGTDFVFASEIKALLAHPKVPDELDSSVVPDYLRFGYVPTPLTFYKGIRSVPAGHVLVLESDMTMRLERYWAPPLAGIDMPVTRLSFAEMASETRRLLEESVKRRLLADVPLGAFLSGGVDSSAVVGVMSTLLTDPVKTFTIGFDDTDGFDERAGARRAAERFGTDHNEFVVRPQAVDLVEDLVWHHDQPFGDSSAIPTYLLSKLTREHVTVALSGDGGDELFGGYERFAAALWLERFDALPASLRTTVTTGASRIGSAAFRGRGRSLQRFVTSVGRPPHHALRDWVGYIDEDTVRSLTSSATPPATYEDRWSATAGADLLDRILRLNLDTYLVDDLLVKVDRMSMAHALEVRCPLLDHRLLEFAFGLPREARIKRLTLKRVLKAAVADLVPPELIKGRKRGFGVPLDRWFRTDLQSFMQDRLLGPGSKIDSWLSKDAVRRLVDQHDKGEKNHGHALWTLLTLEVFLRERGK